MDGACILAALVSVVSCPAGASEVPDRDPLVRQGQPGRRVLGGRWRFRLEGRKRWRGVTIPHDWNGADRRLNRSGVGWYRRDLRLPRLAAGTKWIVRFEAAGHQTTVYLNGRRIRRHHGNYLPFEAVLTGLRRGSNRLTVRVSSRRTHNDLTHWRRARPKGFGQGGWWNFGGIHREVSVRPARGLDISRAQALTRMACPACAARVEVRALVRNVGSATVRPRVVARAAGQEIALRAPLLAPGRGAEAVGALTVERPQLWDIGHGRLYDLQVEATGPAGSARHASRFGIRDVRKFPDGHVELNGRPLFVKGVSMHEDHPRVGSAYRKRHLDAILRRLEQLGATVLRTHYPLHPYLMEELDRRGIMIWNGAPINVVQNDRWRNPNVTRAAIRLNQQTVLRDRGHPSVLAFSVANELAIPVTGGQRRFLRAAAAAVRRLDPTRLVALDRVARYGSPSDADPVFGVFDALGVNEYFGWYRGAHKPRPPAYTRDLPAYFDILHRQQPRAALFVTEFGAEANRPGPVSEKGTYAFQASYIRRHIAMARSRPFVNGAIVWALRDFRVHSAWNGGNPRPRPPYNQKGLISVRGRAKPGFRATCRAFAAIGPPGLAGTACR